MQAAKPRLRATLSRFLALLLVSGAWGVTAHATTVQRMSVPDMLDRADDVVRVRVVENLVRTDPDTLYHWTVTTFQVVDSVKGPLRAGELLDVEVIGGEAPGSGYATVVADAPRFDLDEEVVLFSYNTRDGRRQPVGFYQGAVRLRPSGDGDGLEAILHQASVSHELTEAGPKAVAPLRRVGEPAPAADPTVGRGRGTADGQGQGQALGVNRRVMAAEDFMAELHAMVAAIQEERP